MIDRIPRRVWIVVVVVLVTLLAWQAWVWRASAQDDDRRAAAVAVAKEQVLDITTLDSDSVGAKLKSMSARTSGDFKNEVTNIAATFVKVVKEQKISATGSIDSAAVTSDADGRATVLVASTAVVKQKGTKAKARTYRMRVKLTRASGEWKINGMEFVQ